MIVVGQQFSQNLRALELIAAAITPIATNPKPETRILGGLGRYSPLSIKCFAVKRPLVAQFS